MRYQFTAEYEIQANISKLIEELLVHSFGTEFYTDRDYFKQIPHHRLLVWDGDRLIAQLGVDHRVMSLDSKPVFIFGIVDLCVHSDYRGKGVGKGALTYLENVAKAAGQKVDFLFLVTDTPEYYARLGFLSAVHEIVWLKIDQHESLGLGKEKIDDASFMIKSISDKKWEGKILDMMGYMF